MSKKRLVTLILSIGIFLSLAATVFAAGQPRRYNENSTVKGTISQSFYQVNFHYLSFCIKLYSNLIPLRKSESSPDFMSGELS